MTDGTPLSYAPPRADAAGAQATRIPRALWAFALVGLVAAWLPIEGVNGFSIVGETVGALRDLRDTSGQPRTVSIARLALNWPVLLAPLAAPALVLIWRWRVRRAAEQRRSNGETAQTDAAAVDSRLAIVTWIVAGSVAAVPIGTLIGLAAAGFWWYFIPLATIPITFILGAWPVIGLARRGRTLHAALVLVLLGYIGCAAGALVLTAYQFSWLGWPLLALGVLLALWSAATLWRWRRS